MADVHVRTKDILLFADDLWCDWHAHLASTWECDYTRSNAQSRDPNREAIPVKVLVFRKES